MVEYNGLKIFQRAIRACIEHSKSITYAESPKAFRSNWMPCEIVEIDSKKGKCMVMTISNYKSEAPKERATVTPPNDSPLWRRKGIGVIQSDLYQSIKTIIQLAVKLSILRCAPATHLA